MDHSEPRAIAIVGMSAIMPDAADAATFWRNLTEGRYSITDVPPERWDPELYYDPDPAAPDKTYSRIGGWVRDFEWDPLGWRLPIPPKVSEQMDEGQQWAVNLTRAALADAGWSERPVDPERVAVIIGNAIGGEKHYATSMRIQFPEFARELAKSPSFAALSEHERAAIIAETAKGFTSLTPPVTEDTMPGELANCIAGRIANQFNFRGPNYTTDAACASAMAAMSAAVDGLLSHQYDAVLTGGIDRNMGVAAFVKFCAIGALSATGTRPYADGADGFVMGEGGALFVLKRLADAERDGDRIYAVVRGIAGSSDGKGKGITAPNPVGQRLAVERAWRNAGLDPHTATLVEGHGTSTRVGDVVEVEALQAAFGAGGVEPGSIALGSVKSNIGHLKAAAGAAGLFKSAMALSEKVLPPSINFERPNPSIDWSGSPFRVNVELRDWPEPDDAVRLAGVSAFGFGGTNFHAVLSEYVPGELRGDRARSFAGATLPQTVTATPAESTASPAAAPASAAAAPAGKAPLRGALVLGGDTPAAIAAQLDEVAREAVAGSAPEAAPPDPALADAPVRLAIDYGDAADLADKCAKAQKALAADAPPMWKMLRSQGIFLGRGPAPKVAFLYTGQGSQYVNMLADLRAVEPIVADTFVEADTIMTPLLGKPLTDYIFIDATDGAAVQRLELQLLQTEITQPAVLATDLALTRLLEAYGVKPDMVMGHSLGEYGALVASGALTFEAALEAVSARGREMAHLSVEDNGAMAAVFAPLPEIEQIVADTDGYVVLANINSNNQAVIGGGTAAVEHAVEECIRRGHTAVRIPVSHAFHTAIVAPASEPLKVALTRLNVRGPELPTVANVTGEFYPRGASLDQMLDILSRQVASPVQFVKGLHTLYDAGARVFVEVGPKKALHGFAEDVLGGAHDDVSALFANHPKQGGVVSFNQALCGLYAAGHGLRPVKERAAAAAPVTQLEPVPAPVAVASARVETPQAAAPARPRDDYLELRRTFAEVLERGRQLLEAQTPEPAGGPDTEPVVITGAALGLPGVERVFDDANLERLLAGESFIGLVPDALRQEIIDKRITRLVKRENGDPTFETIATAADVIKLAGRRAPFDVAAEFGVESERVPAYDTVTSLAIGAGYDALRDAGIPLLMHYKTTTLGTQLPDRWGLPAAMRDDTGVVFASAFPGYDAFAEDLNAYHEDRARRGQLRVLQDVLARLDAGDAASGEISRRIDELQAEVDAAAFRFDRRFLFRALSMGHAQFAELIGARGPNTQVNAACASTTQAIAVAEDWIRAGRCSRVIVIAADDVTSDALLPWAGSGFLASGAAATDDVVEEAALPFDNRRHGMIMGMGAAALVVESAAAARQRGVRPICEVLSTVTANSAYHGTRLDVDHVSQVMERLLRQAEARGIDRSAIAPKTVFVSHETYTPARGGSAAAEIYALRHVFGHHADQILITNTKGFTGHAMGAGVEDVLAVKSLETGIVPPVANFKEVDPTLGELNLSRGGEHDVDYALRLAAGFGSQISMALLKWSSGRDRRRRPAGALGYAGRIADERVWREWLAEMAGRPDPELEVDHRRLRVRDGAGPASAPVSAASVSTAAPAVLAPDVPAAPVEGPAAEEVPPAAAPAAAASAGEAPVAAPVAASAAVAEAPAGPSAAEVEAKVLELVAEMTGYPSDLLDLDLDLEADLGVDTVKQAEVFAAVRAAFAIARDDALQLRDFPTLNHVIGFVLDRAGTEAEVAGASAAAAPAAAASAAEAPVAAPVAASAAVAEAPAGPSAAEVEAKVLELVAEMTGYPSDLLDLDLDLEADLGVDTVKQAEVFAAVRAAFAIARDDALQLRDFPTLNHVIGFVLDRAGTEAEVAAPGQGADEPAEPALRARPPLEGDLEATDGVPRRMPVPVLRPDLSACKPTAVELEGRRVVVMLDEAGVGREVVERLGRAGAVPLTIEPGAATDALQAQLDAWMAEAPIAGVYWLAALDDEGPMSALDLSGWREALRRRVKNLYETMRRLDDHIAGPDTFLVGATRLGGRHGYDDAGAVAPLGGAVTGFVKAFKRERPEALVKVVDFPAGGDPGALAGRLVDETLRDPGAVEVGHTGERRWTIALREAPFGDGTEGWTLSGDQVFVVTGAAGSIVSAIVADLARASGGAFHLLDLTPEPDPADSDLQRYIDDREGLKGEIASRLKAAGERPTPVLIERQLAQMERAHAALAAIQAVSDAGGEVHYHSVDLTDPEAVAHVVQDISARHGRIDCLLHAAGLEISRGLSDKERREYDLVFDVKSDGWFNLLSAAGDLPIGATVAFSSIAGRFGNAGQTDYSAANDLLCKVTSSFRSTRPQTRGIALDWTAWGGIGMATRGSIPKIMELAGIDMLPPEAGIAWIRRELTAASGGGEVVVAGELGVLMEEFDDTAGLDVAAIDTGAAGPMVGYVAGMRLRDGLVVETKLDPSGQPFLADHAIDGTPLLPGVMGIESFAEVAALLVPGWHVIAVEDVDYLAPFKFYRCEPRTLEITAQLRPDGEELLGDCRLIGERTLAGRDQPQRTVHFTGTVRLAAEPATPEQHEQGVPEPGSAVESDAVYRVYFHGPAYQVLDRAWAADGAVFGRQAADLPANHQPDAPTLIHPRLVELCFQTAGVWEIGRTGRLALPQHLDRVRVLGDVARGTVHAVVVPGADGFACRVVDEAGRTIVGVDGYRTVPMPGEVDAALRSPLQAAME